MKYTRPEVEIMELDVLDVIQTSGTYPEEEKPVDPTPGGNGGPMVPFSRNIPTI